MLCPDLQADKPVTIKSKVWTVFKKEPKPPDLLPPSMKAVVVINREWKNCQILDKKNGHTLVRLPATLGEWWVQDEYWWGVDGRPIPSRQLLITTKVGRIHLHVPYYKQKTIEEGGYRSSLYLSCACAAMYLRPEAFVDPDEYYERVQAFGGHESPYANVDLLRSVGVRATYYKNGIQADLKRAIDNCSPIICCALNEGDMRNAKGEGHWVTVVGYDENKRRYIVNDPLGKFLHRDGVYEHDNGEAVEYTTLFFRYRWTADGWATGWYIVFEGW
jgi:hypothetical protein